jgi:hypothetical protein
MASYLERYRQGECEQVWAELLALGGRVREPQFYAEAVSVAQETISRARANIESLVPRLTTLGYRFAHPNRVFVPTDAEFRSRVAEIERRAGPLPLSLRAWCDVVGEVNFMGSHPRLSTYFQSRGGEEVAQNYLALFAKHGGAAVAPGTALPQAAALSQRLLKEVVERMQTGQPRSPDLEAGVRASREILQTLQRPAAVSGPDVESDPLVVEPYFGDLEDALDQGEDNEDAGDAGDAGVEDEGPFAAWIAPDATQKTHQSGGSPYCLYFPDPAVDAALEGEEDYGTFVEYLRTCFRWGGFPGLRASAKPPREELAYLTEGLLPL